ncbi:hypothetical protein NDU88_007367 [Pleurodeles waltl]|uniref:Uncharacterized protein n=1 Tax=Pleurodeles waltl TaxID=8319 RepID=A0AAV7MF05_PLEWA|nr:hypothetical protein NDU88_007367 [Pleurodeles waltl]
MVFGFLPKHEHQDQKARDIPEWPAQRILYQAELCIWRSPHPFDLPGTAHSRRHNRLREGKESDQETCADTSTCQRGTTSETHPKDLTQHSRTHSSHGRTSIICPAGHLPAVSPPQCLLPGTPDHQ